MSNTEAARSIDLSPGATTVAFDPIIPPLRVPVPAGEEDDRSKGEWLLAFKDDDSWRRALHDCYGKISEQCEMGARMGCSLSAGKACRTPWWKNVLVYIKVARFERREQEACEEREMAACLASSRETCMKYARDTCEPVFADARIADPHITLDPRFTGPFRRKRWTNDNKKKIAPAALDGKNPNVLPAEAGHLDNSKEGLDLENDLQKSTNYRGRKLITEMSIENCWDGPAWTEGLAEERERSQGKETPSDGWEGGLIRPKLDSKKTVQSSSRT